MDHGRKAAPGWARRLGLVSSLFLLGAGASDLQVQVSGAQVWGLKLSPDAASVLGGATRDGRDEAGVFLFKGDKWQTLFPWGEGWAYQPLGWSSDGTLAILRKSSLDAERSAFVLLVDPASGAVAHELPGRRAWMAPDGQHLLLQGDSEVQIFHLSSGTSHPQVTVPPPPESFTPPSCHGAWAPSGLTVAYTQVSEDSARLFRAQAPAWQPELLLSAALPDRLLPAWSPDGRRLAVLQLSVAEGSRTRLILLDPASGETRLLQQWNTLAPEVAPLWSADGQSIVLLVVEKVDRITGRGKPLPLLVEVSSGTVRALSEATVDEGDLRWSPDGQELWLVQTGGVQRFPVQRFPVGG